MGRGWGGVGADQPAPLPDYKVTWLWGGGGPACSFTGLQINIPLPDYKVTDMALGRGWGGGHDKHTRSTAAGQPAPLPDYKVTWLWGGGGGVGMISTPAQLLQTSLLLYRITKYGSGEAVGGGGMISTPAQQLQTSLLLYQITK